MRNSLPIVFLASACLFVSPGLDAQSAPTAKASSNGGRISLTVQFQSLRANTVPAYDFWMQGAGLQVAGNLNSHWSVVADLSGQHNGQLPHMNTGLDLFTVTFGPRFTFPLRKNRIRAYGQVLGGTAYGWNSLFPGKNSTESSASGSALLAGGGIKYRLSHRISLTVFDANWLRTAVGNGTTTVQNNLRLGSGLALQFCM